MASGCEEKFYICPAHAAHVRGVRVVATLCMMVIGGTTGAARQNNREVLECMGADNKRERMQLYSWAVKEWRRQIACTDVWAATSHAWAVMHSDALI